MHAKAQQHQDGVTNAWADDKQEENTAAKRKSNVVFQAIEMFLLLTESLKSQLEKFRINPL